MDTRQQAVEKSTTASRRVREQLRSVYATDVGSDTSLLDVVQLHFRLGVLLLELAHGTYVFPPNFRGGTRRMVPYPRFSNGVGGTLLHGIPLRRHRQK